MSDDYDYSSILGNPTGNGPEVSPLDDIFGDVNVFDNVDRDSLPDNPFELPANTYRFRINGAEMKMTEPKNGQSKKCGLILKYVVAEGSYANRRAGEWLRIPYPNEIIEEADKVSAMSNLNLHLKAFGLSDEQIKGFNHRNCNQLLGAEFYGTTVNVTNREDPSRKDIKLVKWIPLSGGGSDDGYDVFRKTSGPAY